MLFNSYRFILLFFPAVLAVSARLKGPALIRWITLASVVFYSYAGQKWFVIPMIFTTTLDFFLAKGIERAPGSRYRRFLLIISLCGNLGLLFLFKYGGLFDSIVDPAGRGPLVRVLSLGLPAGISFYTFQTLSYIIDVYRGTCSAESSFWKFACFVSFFPHLVAGPLTRHDQLIPQLNEIAKKGIAPRWSAGIFLFAVGLTKKVLVADRVGGFIDPLLSDVHSLNFVSAWLCVVGYAMQIYFDFSGYSDMAIGLGRLFGIELPQNFNSPYMALNPSDFWKRWHMTLSRWLKDYLYISLGGNRRGPFRRNVNLMITMALGGFWHGANWTFIGWGIFHGTILVVYHGFQETWDAAPHFLQRTLTFLLVCLGWVFFRARSYTECFLWFRKLFAVDGFAAGQAIQTFDGNMAALGALVLMGMLVVNGFRNASSRENWEGLGPSRQFGLGLLTVGAVVMMNYSSKFLYYQF